LPSKGTKKSTDGNQKIKGAIRSERSNDERWEGSFLLLSPLQLLLVDTKQKVTAPNPEQGYIIHTEPTTRLHIGNVVQEIEEAILERNRS
jgi:hypothetical protein